VIAFVLRMLVRELRASWARLLFFFLCVALGVASLVALRSVVQNVRTTLLREARALVGADLVVQSSRAWTPETKGAVDQLLHRPEVRARTEVVETQTMATSGAPGAAGGVRLVELRGVESAFPFYGTLELAGGRPYTHALLAGRGALVTPEFLSRFGLSTGDTITLAGQPFTIRGVVTRDRVQRAGGIAFGPRVYVDLADLRALSILSFGSRATYEIFLRVDEGALADLTAAFVRDIPREVVRTRSWQGVEDQIGRNLALAERYLSLVGFAMVVLGGIGVWSVTRVFVQQKIKSVAVLKCLGATSGLILATYVLQVVVLAACGSALGIGIAAAGLGAIPIRILEPLGLTSATVTPGAAAHGAAVGVLVSLFFALVPLLEIRRVKPLLLLRADAAPTAGRQDWQSRLAGAATFVALALVAVWQSASVPAGLFVAGGLVVVGAALLGASRLLVWAVRPLTRSRRFAIRHAIVSLERPGSQARVILMSVGLGCFFILSIRAVQANLVDEFTRQVGQHAPDLVLIDVQRDQVEGVRATVTPYLREPARLLPLMRARVVAVDGRRVHLPTPEAVREQGELTREYGMTFRTELQDNERLVAGAFWAGPLTGPSLPDGSGLDTEVSIEQLVHDSAQIDVGDVMRFDVAGRALRARVTSIRKVSWDEAQNGGFVFVLRPGPAVDRAPHSYVGFLQLRPDPSAQGALERALVAAHPNVSAIDVRDVLKAIQSVIDNATLGVTVVGAVTMVGGVLILVGSVAMTKFQRLYDAAIYRALGAGTRALAAMAAVEYGVLGSLAGLLGAVGALGLSWAIARWLFEMDWRPAFGMLAAGVVLTAVAVAVVGLVASADVLVRKPLDALRRE
jgi:putative ABC transport system permease protein